MGLNAPIIARAAVHLPELIELGGWSVENLLFTDHFHEGMIRTELGKKFRNLHMHVTGKPLRAASVLAADAYLLILAAIARAGSSDPRAIRDALCPTVDFQGVAGTISTAKDGRAARPVFLVELRDGKFAYVPRHDLLKAATLP